jgi:hypothetical protein
MYGLGTRRIAVSSAPLIITTGCKEQNCQNGNNKEFCRINLHVVFVLLFKGIKSI